MYRVRLDRPVGHLVGCKKVFSSILVLANCFANLCFQNGANTVPRQCWQIVIEYNCVHCFGRFGGFAYSCHKRLHPRFRTFRRQLFSELDTARPCVTVSINSCHVRYVQITIDDLYT